MSFEIEKRIELNDLASPRATVLKVNGHTVEFPTRAISSSDLFHSEKVMKVDEGAVIDLMGSIFEIKKLYKQPKLEAVAESDSLLNKEIAIVRKIANKRQGSLRILNHVVRKNAVITDEQHDALVSIQTEGNLDVLLIHDTVWLTLNELETRIRKTIADNGNMPVILVAMPISQESMIFEQKIQVALQLTDGIAYKFASPTSHLRQYDVIKRYTVQEKWFHVMDISKTWGGNDRTSFMHFASLYGLDSFSLLTRQIPPPENPAPPKRFDSESWGYLVMPNEHYVRHGDDLACHSKCPIDRERTMKDILNDFSPDERPSAFRVHECFESQLEFFNIREKILEGVSELQTYLSGIEYARYPMQRHFGTSF